MDIELLRSICLKMPAAKEEIKWEQDLVFTIGGKMFCVASTELPFVFSLKVPEDCFEDWCAQPNVIPAPYMARAKWVQFKIPQQLATTQVEKLVAESFQLVASKLTKKQREALSL